MIRSLSVFRKLIDTVTIPRWCLRMLVLFLVVATLIQLSTVRYDIFWQDDTQILEFGRSAVQKDQGWSMNLEPDQGIPSPPLFWVGPALMWLSLQTGFLFPFGHHAFMIFSHGFFGLGLYMWSRARRFSPFVALLFAVTLYGYSWLLYSVRGGRVDVLSMGVVVWLLAGMWRQEHSESRLPNSDWMYILYGAGMVLASQVWIASALYGVLLIAETFLIGRQQQWVPRTYFRRACCGALGAAGMLLIFLEIMGIGILDFSTLFTGNVTKGSGFREMTGEQYVRNLAAVFDKFLMRRFWIPGLWSLSLVLGWIAFVKEWRMLLALLCAILVISRQSIHDFRTLYLIPFIGILLFSGVQQWIALKKSAFKVPVLVGMSVWVAFTVVNSFVRWNASAFYRREQRTVLPVMTLFREQTDWGGENVYLFSDSLYTTGLELDWRMWALRYRLLYRPRSLQKNPLRETLKKVDYVVLDLSSQTKEVEEGLRDLGFRLFPFQQELLLETSSLYGPYSLWEREKE